MSVLTAAYEIFVWLLRQVGRVQARVLVAAVYIIIVLPMTAVARLAVDPLRMRRRHADASGWLPLTERSPADLERQF